MAPTPTEWAALIAAGAALIGSAGSAFATYKVTARSVRAAQVEGDAARTYDAKQRDLDREHERTLHSQDRAYDRKADACVAVTTSISWMQDYVIYWRQQIALNDPDTTLKRLPPLEDDADFSPPKPPETYVDTMGGLVRLFLDKPTKEKIDELLVSFTGFRIMTATKMGEIEEVALLEDKVLAAVNQYGDEVHRLANEAIELVKEELKQQTA
ncbi:MAG TPA: hypothetical protein VH012_07280 [Acidimicrobiales bacterium]|nr:hypothetical protein [Acidimicrobiales bacterium]